MQSGYNLTIWRTLLFPFYRVLQHGAKLGRHSVPLNDLLNDLNNKSVAIVGNSRALANQSYGAEIDGADIVIRINRAPMPSTLSHGKKTSWLALAVALDQQSGHRVAADRVLWMSPKRKRLPYWVLKHSGFHLFDLNDIRALQKELGTPPTTGLMIINLVRNSKAKAVNLYGFDFFASLSLTGTRTAAQVPHDFPAEKQWVDDLVARNPRFTIVR